jgi:hypothetical protein
MKSFTTALLACLALTALSTSASLALVREIADCTTSQGMYKINIADNQGIGFNRSSNLKATVSSASGTLLASFPVKPGPTIRSASFGRQQYLDTASNGGAFTLSGPSTNFRHYSINAKFNSNGNAMNLSDDNLQCRIFGGVVLK